MTGRPIILASGSEIRATMLRQAGVAFDVSPARVDEEAIRESLSAEGASSRDLADTLAEMKARRVSERAPDALVIGADQILDLDGRVFGKAVSLNEARAQLMALAGQTHRLFSAAVVCHEGRPIWRQVGVVRMTMRPLGPEFIDSYLARNWPAVATSVGCYRIEEEGVRLFSRIDGDFFHILGLPLIELLTWLGIRGDIPS